METEQVKFEYNLCHRWRFALTELQISLSVLIKRFKFSLPQDKAREIRPIFAVTLAPVQKNGSFGLPIVVRDVDD